MYPNLFPLARDSAAVTALLGSSPVRFWPFDIAPGPNGAGYAVPYAVHQLIYGNPDNSLSCTPKEDMAGIQIDAYGATASEAREVSAALRDAIEADFNHVVSYNGEFWDQPSGLYRVSFTAEFWTERGS